MMPMTSAQKREDSVQVSLAELRRLELARLEAKRELEARARKEAEERAAEAERRREAEARAEAERRRAEAEATARARLAEERALEAASERARIAAQAELEAKRLELDIKRTEAQMAQAQATLPQRRSLGPILVLALILGVAQGLMGWRMHELDKTHARIAADLREMSTRLKDAEAGHQAMTKTMDAMASELAGVKEAGSKAPGQGASQATPAQAQPSAPRTPKPDRTPRPEITPVIDVGSTDEPLG